MTVGNGNRMERDVTVILNKVLEKQTSLTSKYTTNREFTKTPKPSKNKQKQYYVKHYRFPSLAYAPPAQDISDKGLIDKDAKEPDVLKSSRSFDRSNIICHNMYRNRNSKHTTCEAEVNKVKLPPLQLNPAENSSRYLSSYDNLSNEYTEFDVTPNSSMCFRNVRDKENRLTIHSDRTIFKGKSWAAIKERTGSSVTLPTASDQSKQTTLENTRFKSRHTFSAQINSNTRKAYKLPVTSTMSALKIDNRHDMAANDHVKQHLKRQEQWLRSERLKNWRRNPSNKQSKKLVYQHSTSSGQKSDVISGKSDETMNTHSSSSSDYQQPIVEEMDDERREAINKCLKWMEHLPKKFSGMHMFAPVPSDQS